MPFTNSERYIAGTKAMLCTVCVGYKTIKLRESFCSAGEFFYVELNLEFRSGKVYDVFE